MAITITDATQTQRLGMQSIEQLTQSTATAAQTVSAVSHITVVGVGTATGTLLRNQYLLPSGPDGLTKYIYMAATGEATVQMTMATGQHYIGRDIAGVATATNVGGAVIGAATGALVLSAKGDYISGMFMDGGWTILGSNATFATAT